MRYRAVIPVKALAEAKSRLAPFVSLEEREYIVLNMLHHVIDTLHRSNVFESVSVVSPDTRVLTQVQTWGAHALVEEQQGHNPALTAAARRELVPGATGLLTISADLPLLQVDDIQRMVALSAHYEVVLAPSREGTGTNALFLRPPLALPYLFGVGSLQRYLDEARKRSLSSTTCTRRGLSLDIDTIDDLEELQWYQQECEVA